MAAMTPHTHTHTQTDRQRHKQAVPHRKKPRIKLYHDAWVRVCELIADDPYSTPFHGVAELKNCPHLLQEFLLNIPTADDPDKSASRPNMDEEPCRCNK